MTKLVYLDYAAATPVDKRVLEAMQPYYAEKFYNPAAGYMAAVKIKDDITEAKKRIASHLGAKYSELIHTSGGTEANNLAIYGVMSQFPEKKILVSSLEHESVLNPAKQFDYQLIPVNKSGAVEVEELAKMIDDDTVLISSMLANNEIGTIQPIRDIAELVNKVRKDRKQRKINTPLYFHTDGCQAPLYLDIHVHQLGVDMMTLNGGKIYGPKQSGILYAASEVKLKPQILGGGQQRGLRSGTESPASVVGFAKALDIATDNKQDEIKRLKTLQTEFINGLQKIYPTVVINGSLNRRLPNNIHATFPGIDNETLLFQMDSLGILAASGSACSASSDEPSHVLKAIGLSDDLARNSIRFTLGRQTKKSDIEYTLKHLKTLFA